MNKIVAAALKTYAKHIRDLRLANPAVSEPALAPAFQTLITDLLPLLPGIPQITVVPEYQKPGAGRPDIALVTPGQPPRAFVELKAPIKAADPTRWREPHDKRQFERLKEFRHWGTCNFADFQLWTGTERVGEAAVVPSRALSPDQTDARADALIDAHNPAAFLDVLGVLCRAHPPTAATAKELAALLAHSARYVRSVVQERIGELHLHGPEDHALLQVRATFRDVLYAHPEAGGYASADFDPLFAGAFAQTLAFGMLLVRESSDGPVGENAWQHMPDEHPLMKTALRVLSLEEVVHDVGIGFELLQNTVNSFSPEILAIDATGRDPILYFYEDFLQVFDPAARERYGVYYTPVEVVRYMVGALDRALRDDLGTQGLRDPAVTILDPATGTGTFPLGVAERVRQQTFEETGSDAEAQMALRELASRLYGFELLVGPYAVAHYRLHHALARAVEGQPPANLPRLGIYLADTLARPGGDAPAGPLGFVAAGLQDERREANRIKAEQPILAIIGNPPYRRLGAGENETLVGRWMDELWDDLKAPVRDAGWGNQLNTFPELSVAFWRWAMWKLFEADNAPRKGVVAFITNRKFLTGKPYAGLRKMMRERFDRIEIIDLRGDVRAGVRGNVAGDQGVFNIQVGTSICVATASGTQPAELPAKVRYIDSWLYDLFARKSKLDWLNEDGPLDALACGVTVERDWLDDLRPEPFSNGEWVSLQATFSFVGSGLQTKRDKFVYGLDEANLLTRLTAFASMADGEAREAFHDSRDRTWKPARDALFDSAGNIAVPDRIIAASYRPLDRRRLFNHPAFGDFLRPDTQRAWGAANTALHSLPLGVGAGPAVWCHGLLPDYHGFRGSYGGYVFPLNDRRAGPNAHNISTALIAHLGEAYGVAVAPEDVFDAILALLSATSYTHLFAEDLEDTFPHVPFPALKDTFDRAVAIGRDIRAIETFARPPATVPGLAKLETQTQDGDLVQAVRYHEGEIVIGPEGRGRLSGITGPVWEFAVSGYRVLPRWIDGREGQPATLAFIRELRDVASRIHELIHHFDSADLVLADTLAHTLTRAELGFGGGIEDAEAADDD
jgi:hypothetical protein